jgi:hypothetical protein
MVEINAKAIAEATKAAKTVINVDGVESSGAKRRRT